MTTKKSTNNGRADGPQGPDYQPFRTWMLFAALMLSIVFSQLVYLLPFSGVLYHVGCHAGNPACRLALEASSPSKFNVRCHG